MNRAREAYDRLLAAEASGELAEFCRAQKVVMLLAFGSAAYGDAMSPRELNRESVDEKLVSLRKRSIPWLSSVRLLVFG